MKLIGIGDNVVDDYVHLRTLFPGGNALNVAVYASMLGAESAYLGVFGTDAGAGHVRRTLVELGLDISHCRSADGPNGRATLTVEHGERVFFGSNEGGVRKSVPMDFVLDDPDYLNAFAVMHTSAYSYLDNQLERLQELDPLLSYDFSDDFDAERALPLCRHVDIGFFSCAEWPEDATLALLRNAVEGGCSLAAATRGANEAILFDGDDWFRQAPEPVTPTDTLGAGDAFISGFLVTYAGGRADQDVGQAALIESALGQAAAFAAEICKVRGAFGHGLPY
jgi:fructoselysine 6-kinase